MENALLICGGGGGGGTIERFFFFFFLQVSYSEGARSESREHETGLRVHRERRDTARLDRYASGGARREGVYGQRPGMSRFMLRNLHKHIKPYMWCIIIVLVIRVTCTCTLIHNLRPNSLQ